ncbi:MAG: hypothetical protein EOP11_04400 [Proteobacteria bacterium]|nr:MAG: hypothetical protein EOP11_04400 [Pseudomonadota bacterium]
MAIGLALFGVLSLTLLSIGGDPFYLLHAEPRRGADVGFYDNERLFKYWLSRRFVPEAYEAVILGPSYTASLDPAGEPAAAGVYNLSFRGANSVEMLTLGEGLLGPKSRIKVAYLCLDPYVVRSLNPRTQDMDPRTLRMAILSWPILGHFFQRAFFPLNPQAKYFTPQGANNEYAYLEGKDSGPHIEEELRVLVERFRAPFRAKPGAVENLARLIARLRERGIRVVGFLPPKPAAHRRLKAADYEAYVREVIPQFGPMDQFLNFEKDAPLDDRYFVDAGGHLSSLGSAWLLRALLGRTTSPP